MRRSEAELHSDFIFCAVPHFHNRSMQFSTASVLKAMTVFSLMLPYIGGVYFRAATASLSDAYQPGIESLKLWIQPGLVLLVPLLLAWLLKSMDFLQVAQWSSILGLVTCIVLLVFCRTYVSSTGVQWVSPENRLLAGTVQQALFSHHFQIARWVPSPAVHFLLPLYAR